MVRIRPSSVAFVVLTAAAGLLWAGQGRAQKIEARSQPVPMRFGGWIGKVLPVDRRVVEILETPDVALVEYRFGQQPPIWFAQVSGFGKRAAFHPPELCYVGDHFEVLERHPLPVMVNGHSVQVMRLVLSQANQRFEAWYWFTANGRATANYYQQQLWLIADTIHGQQMSGTMIRISTPFGDPVEVHRRLEAFMNAFAAASSASHGSSPRVS